MKQLEERLGYHFKDEALLRHALIHSSWSNEHKLGAQRSNERLEFLGDSILGFVTAEHLFRQNPDAEEGTLTRTRAALVCEGSLHDVAQTLELGKFLSLGHGEETGGGRMRASILADAVEAVFAAIYLDGGIDAARAVITRLILERGVISTVQKDHKTALQEVVQRTPGQKLAYSLVAESGPDHQKEFVAAVCLNGTEIGRGTGRSKKEAEQSAAQAALVKIGG